jgi:hypothetical protein
MSMNLTEDQLLELYWYPFPPEEGFKYDPIALAHWLEATTEPISGSATFNAGDSTRTVRRSIALARAVAEIIEQARVECRVATSLDEGSVDALSKLNESRLVRLADGLLAESPVCDVPPVPLDSGPPVLGPHLVLVVIPPVVQPPPVHPEWEPGEVIDPVDLVAVATRLRTATRLPELDAMAPAFEAAARRLYDAAQLRLG